VGDVDVTGLLDLSGFELAILVAAVATGAVWLVAAVIVYAVRKPPEPPVGPRTLDLGPEPPAVVNFLVNDFRVGDAAVPATLLDLAARNVVEVEQRGPGVFYVRLRPASNQPLTAYERRVLDHLQQRASNGVVPAEALTTGAAEESKRWRRAFSGDVVGAAKAHGLSRDALDGRIFTVLTLAAGAPAVLVWALSTWEAGLGVVGGALVVLGWIKARHPQRETPEGMAAASRWLGVKAELEENEVFPTHSPLTVELWDRLLAYGAALGVASGASGPLPMGTESDTRAWSAHGGRWRPVRVTYARFWPIGWGASPLVVLGASVAAVLVAGLFLYAFGPVLVGAVNGGWAAAIVGVILLVPCAVVVVGVAAAVMASADLRSTIDVTGPILRLRAFGDDEAQRYYVAVDDGTSSKIHAWSVSPAQYAGLVQGEKVSVSVTKHFGCVRSIAREDHVT
jgi:hypothetical protein